MTIITSAPVELYEPSHQLRDLREISFIYLLRHPLTNVPVYVGRTRNPFWRMLVHVHGVNKSNPALQEWIETLRSEGIEPVMDVVSFATHETEQSEEDKWMIEVSKQHPLLNIDVPMSVALQRNN